LVIINISNSGRKDLKTVLFVIVVKMRGKDKQRRQKAQDTRFKAQEGSGQWAPGSEVYTG